MYVLHNRTRMCKTYSPDFVRCISWFLRKMRSPFRSSEYESCRRTSWPRHCCASCQTGKIYLMITLVDRVECLPLAQIKPAARNPRTHSPAQIEKIAKSIERFGFLNPILVDRDDRVIAGHGRVEAAKSLRLDHVPVVRIEHLTDAEKRAYVIADNRLAELAGWDKDILRLELGELTIAAPELDLTVTGYEIAEIDQIVIGPGDEIAADGRADAVPAIDRDRVVSRKGDVWCVGSHRIACGDARDVNDVQAVMRQDRARLILTDPPYNVRIDGHARGERTPAV